MSDSDIEKDVERCKQLIRVEHANWIGISNQLAIKHILEEREQDKKKIKELEEENNKKQKYIKMASEVIENSILKQKVKDKIEKLENDIKSADEFMRRNNIAEDEDFHMDTLFKQCEIRVLEELLEEKQ